MSNDLVYEKRYKNAPKAYREAILQFVEAKRREEGLLVWSNTNSSIYKEGNGGLEVLGRKFSLRVEMLYDEMQFVRFKPVGYDNWGAYWRRGKGMKVYGDYEMFERDTLFVKTAT